MPGCTGSGRRFNFPPRCLASEDSDFDTLSIVEVDMRLPVWLGSDSCSFSEVQESSESSALKSEMLFESSESLSVKEDRSSSVSGLGAALVVRVDSCL